MSDRLSDRLKEAQILNESLRERLEAAEKEIAESWVDADKYDNQQSHIDALQAELTAKKTYVQHTETCPIAWVRHRLKPTCECECGLAAVLEKYHE